MGDITTRSAAQVFESHLELRKRNDLETDLATNYAKDVLQLTCTGIYHGHDGVRASAQELGKCLPDGEYTYVKRLVEGEVAFLVWTGRSPAGHVCDGVDSFVIRDGRIVAQTIHYTVDHKP
jgi:hypothetical protein